MVKLLLTGFVAGAFASSYVSHLLAEDNECGTDEQCSLNALQRHALSKTQEDPQAAWSQCGGKKWTGSTVCETGSECKAIDQWYSQCVPDGSPAPPPPAAHQDEHLGSTQDEPVPWSEYTGPTMPPLPENPPTPQPTTIKTVNPIVTRGNFLYDSVTGKRFFAKGVAYNPRNEKYAHDFGPSVTPSYKEKHPNWKDTCVPGHPEGGTWSYTEDVQADEHEATWSKDLEAMANLGANTVRLYNVDPSKSHTKFMKKAESLGIYVIVPLNGKDFGFLPAFPSPDCYEKVLPNYGSVGVNALAFAKQMVKQFSQFPNTLLFTVANELAQNDKNGFAAFPCVKALTRDIHQYQASCNSTMRRVPLIYSDVDMGPPDRSEIAKYLTCALESEDDAVDAYGLNVYSWCDEAYPGDGKDDNFKYSPYYEIHKGFDHFSVPLLFTEFGCNLGAFATKCPYKNGRTWPDFKHMVGEDMGETLSGAVAFQYSMDKEEYGLVITPNFLANQTELYLLDNYFALQKVYNKYNVKSDWDATADKVSSCSFQPSDVHDLKKAHNRAKCPSKAVWTKIQTRKGLEKIGDWSIIPATPPQNSTQDDECPAASISAEVKKENCCHMKC